MKLDKLTKLGKLLKLDKVSIVNLVPTAALSAVLGALAVNACFCYDTGKLKSIIAEQRKSIADLTAEIDKFTVKEPVECPEAIPSPGKTEEKQCADKNRYNAEMETCKDFFDAAMHISAGTQITCRTAKMAHRLIDRGIAHCDLAAEDAGNAKEKGKAEFQKRELTALSREPKITPPVCRIKNPQ